MTPKITEEQRQALQQSHGEMVEVEDDQTRKVYLLIERQEACQRFDDWLRQELQIGFDQSDRGESEVWNIEATLAEARRRHDHRSS
jgi:hypothetical protein